MSGRWVLGLAGSHNGAACLMRDGEVVAAIQEERLSRKKRALLKPGEPSLAVLAVLAAAGIDAAEVGEIAVAPLPSPEAVGSDPRALGAFRETPRAFVPHHLAHAASAVYWSGWQDAVVLVVDGAGSVGAALTGAERALLRGGEALSRESMSIYAVKGGILRPLAKELAPPHGAPRGFASPLGPFKSAGLMYQAVAQYIFGGWDSAGKVMGLAPYAGMGFGGRGLYPVDAFWRAHDGRVVFRDGLDGVGGLLLREGAKRPLGVSSLDKHPGAVRLAASVQGALEALLSRWVRLAARLGAEAGVTSGRLLLAGGVFLNGVANEKIIQSGTFEEVFIVPAAEDSGTALGAAALVATHAFDPEQPRVRGGPVLRDALGPTWPLSALETARADALTTGRVTSDDVAWADLAEVVADHLAAGRVVGWYQGQSELGPRALGQRSILFDPRRVDARDRLNFEVKRREGFRPFAPAALVECLGDWFDLGRGPADSPWMLRVLPVREARRAAIPGVVHVDGTARVQSVSPADGLFYEVIKAFETKTGVPMVLNTSFNVAGEPLVESPADAIAAFLGTAIDVLVLGPFVLKKTA